MRSVLTQKVRWSLKDVLTVLASAVVLIYIYKLFEFPYLDDALKGRFPGEGERALALFLVGAVAQAAILVILVAYYLKIRGGRAFHLGLAGKGAKKALSAGFVGGLVIFGLVLVSSELVQWFFSVTPKSQPLTRVMSAQNDLFSLAVPFFIGTVLAPVSEEIYFRGFAYPVLRARLGKYGGMVVSAAFFALLHLDLLRFIPLWVGGLGLAWLYERNQSLYAPIMAHAVWNGSMALLLVANNTFS